MKCLLLYNPNSGKGKLGKKLKKICRRLSSKYTVDVIETSGAEEVEERTRTAAGEYELVVFAGGDGTFHHALQGAAESGVPLGYLPCGTANDIARSLRIPRRVGGALRVILEGRTEALDCLLVNKRRYVMYVAAAGTITTLSYETPQKKKRIFGWFAYVFQGLKNNLKFDVLPIEGSCDGKEISTHGVLVLLLNGRSVAGFPVNKSASMQDGVMEVAVVRQAERPNFFKKIGAYFSVAALMLVGLKIKKRDIEVFRGEHVRISSGKDTVWAFDGERGEAGEIDVELVKGKVRVRVPKRGRI